MKATYSDKDRCNNPQTGTILTCSRGRDHVGNHSAYTGHAVEGQLMGKWPQESVNHPAHYTSSPAKCRKCQCPIECIDITRHLNFNRGNVVKYVWRMGQKGDAIEECKKALWYLQDELARMEAERAD